MEKTVVQAIIYHSKRILELKLCKMQANNLKDMILHIHDSIEIRNLTRTIEKIEEKITTHNNSIKHCLHPLFQGIDFGYENIWGLSTKELKQGYIMLTKRDFKEESMKATHVLFLSSYKGNLNGKQVEILEGSLYPVNEVFPILSSIKGYDIAGTELQIFKVLAVSNPNVTITKKILNGS